MPGPSLLKLFVYSKTGRRVSLSAATKLRAMIRISENPKISSLPSLQASTAGYSILASPKAATSMLTPETTSPMTRDATKAT